MTIIYLSDAWERLAKLFYVDNQRKTIKNDTRAAKLASAIAKVQLGRGCWEIVAIGGGLAIWDKVFEGGDPKTI